METTVGVVDVKSSPVHFYVQRTSPYNRAGTIIPYNILRLNVGGGMNIISGNFTAPKSGIYFFLFSGVKSSPNTALSIDLYQNSTPIARAEGTNVSGSLVLTLSSTLSLTSGDQISLRLLNGELLDNNILYTNFNGMLLQEEM